MTSGDETEAGQGAADDLADWMRRGPYAGQPGPPTQSVGRDAPVLTAGTSYGAPASGGRRSGDRWRGALLLVVVLLVGVLVGLLLGLLIA